MHCRSRQCSHSHYRLNVRRCRVPDEAASVNWLALGGPTERENFATDPGGKGVKFRDASGGVRKGQQREWVDFQNPANCRNFAERGVLHASLERAHVSTARNVRECLLAQAARLAGHLERSGE